MKKRTREQNAAYARTLRARKSAQKAVAPNAVSPVSPAPKRSTLPPLDVLPGNTPPGDAAPTQASAAPCANCIENAAEVSRLRADLAQARAEVSRLRDRIATLEDQTADLPPPEKVSLPHRPPVDRAPTPKPTGTTTSSKDDAQALAARVVAGKVQRINNYSRGHIIGRV